MMHGETLITRLAGIGLALFCGAVLLFLIAPVVAIVPLSFNSEPYLSYPLAGLSLRWYKTFFASSQWLDALRSSVIVGVATTLIATPLGTLAAFGLARRDFPAPRLTMGVLLSPMAVPVVVVALALYLAFSRLGLANSYTGLIIAHTALATPFVVVTVGAMLANFDHSLPQAAASLGAGPLLAFRRVTLPLILPGVVSGALFAFITSWDDVVVALFVAGPRQRTLPRQMFSGLREQLDPTIMVVATILIAISISLFLLFHLVRRRTTK